MLLETQHKQLVWVVELGLSHSQLQLVAKLFAETPPQFHSWMLGAATRMKNAGMTIDQAFKVLVERSERHSRPVSLREIMRAVEKAFNDRCAHFVRAPRRSDFSQLTPHRKLQSFMASSDWPKGYGTEELRNEAPDTSARLCSLRPEQLLNLLFHHCQNGAGDCDRFVCVGAKREGGGYNAETIPFEPNADWSIPDWANLVVPNLARSRTGKTQEGEISKRALTMFPQRDYIVLESDLGKETEDTQAALIRFTQKVLNQRPVMVVRSGGKSLHAWFKMRNLGESKVERLLRELAGLFDTAALNRHQLFRLPNGWRDVGSGEPLVKQEVILFDHEALALP